MSITWFVKKTGLSRPAVIKARDNLLDRDFLIEEEDRGKRGVKLYSVKWQQDTDSEDTPLVNDVDQSLVNDVDQSLVNGVYPLKESSKEKKKKKKDSSHPEGVAINGEKPIETTNNAGAGAYTDTPKAGEPEMTDFEDSLPDEDPPDHTASTVTAVDVSEHAVTPEPTPVQDSDDDPPDKDPDPEPVNPSEDHTHMLACMVWCWANDNYSLMTQRLYFLQGKNTKGKSRWGGEYWEWRLTADNEDHPNNGPVSDAEIMAFGVWLRRKWPNGDDFKRYCPQKAETIHSNLELFRGDESYPALVERARKGLDTILDQGLKGKERDDRIAHLGAALSRPPHKERLPLIPAIMPASPDWVPPANREPVPEMTPEEMRAYVAKGIAESTAKKRLIVSEDMTQED